MQSYQSARQRGRGAGGRAVSRVLQRVDGEVAAAFRDAVRTPSWVSAKLGGSHVFLMCSIKLL